MTTHNHADQLPVVTLKSGGKVKLLLAARPLHEPVRSKRKKQYVWNSRLSDHLGPVHCISAGRTVCLVEDDSLYTVAVGQGLDSHDTRYCVSAALVSRK